MSAVEVTVGKTRAQIPINLPEPDCKLIAEQSSSNLGEKVMVQLSIDSIFSTAKVSGDGFNTYQNFLPSEKRYPLSNLGKWELVGTAEVTIPTNLYQLQSSGIWINSDGSFDDNYGSATLSAKVEGLPRSSVGRTCKSSKIKISQPPPPDCTASVSNPQVLQGQQTNVILNCNKPFSGRVTSAYITRNGKQFSLATFNPTFQGRGNYKIATTPYTRTSLVASEKIEITVIGPGGTKKFSTYLGAVCAFNDANYPRDYSSAFGQPNRVFQRNFLKVDNQFQAHGTGDIINFGDSGRNLYCDSSSFCMVNGLLSGPNGLAVIWIEVGPATSPSCTITEYAIRSDGCFTKDTKIRMVNGEDKLITDLKTDDFVSNPLFKKPVRVSKIVKGPEKRPLYQIKVNTYQVTVTEDHPFLTQRGWVSANHLTSQDIIMGEGLGKKISSIQKLSYKKPVDVYNLELDTDIPEGHLVIANGIPTGDLTTQLNLKTKIKKEIP